jgi:hypothetical protein
MGSGMVYVLIAIVTAALIAGALAVWYVADRAKRRLGAAQGADRRQTAEFTVPGGVAAPLVGLSPEPIFLKQGADGVRVQLENRPFVPIHFLTEQRVVAALRHVAITISERFGPEWSCLVTTRAGGKVSVRRLV